MLGDTVWKKTVHHKLQFEGKYLCGICLQLFVIIRQPQYSGDKLGKKILFG
jgi:hypothetical protein